MTLAAQSVRPRLRWLAWGVIVVIASIPLPGCLAAATLAAQQEWGERPSSTREYASIAHHLRQPFHGYTSFDVFIPEFGIVALSHMAAGLMNVYLAEPDKRDEVHAYLQEVVARALSAHVSPTGRSTLHAERLDDHNLFWSHLGLILGIERYVRCEGRVCGAEPGDTDRLQQRIVEHLRSRMLSTGVYHAPSYPGSPLWPADNAVSLLAMKMYDVTHGSTLNEEPLRGFLRVLFAGRDSKTGLFPSVLSPTGGDVPRGCATSWTVLYLAQLDAEAARDQYDRETTWLAKDVLGVGGFREWPAGRARSSDLDSGPVIFGVGVAATGLGLGAARLFHDDAGYTLARRSALTFGVPAWPPFRGYWAAPILGEAILFNGRTARPWFGELPQASVRRVPSPIGPWLLALLDLGAIAALVRQTIRSPTR